MSGWLSMVCSSDRIPAVEQLVYWSLAVDFFNHLNMLYGTVTEFCIPQEVRCYSLHCLVPPNFWRIWQCPVMSAGPRFVDPFPDPVDCCVHAQIGMNIYGKMV